MQSRILTLQKLGSMGHLRQLGTGTGGYLSQTVCT